MKPCPVCGDLEMSFITIGQSPDTKVYWCWRCGSLTIGDKVCKPLLSEAVIGALRQEKE